MIHEDYDDGFTLLEALVALAILALSCVVLMQAVSGAVSKSVRSARMVEAGDLARQLASRLGASEVVEVRGGQDPASGLWWTVTEDASPLPSLTILHIRVGTEQGARALVELPVVQWSR